MGMRIRLKMSLMIASLAIIFSLSLTTVTSIWFLGTQASDEVAERLFDTVSKSTEREVTGLLRQALRLAIIVAGTPHEKIFHDNGLDDAVLPLVLSTLDGVESIYSIYFGHEDGTFFQVIATRGRPDIIKRHNAPPETRWIVRNIYSLGTQGRMQSWTFLDDAHQRIGGRDEPDPDYDPRTRPWYGTALKTGLPTLSDVYVFNSLQEPGLTASHALADADGVAGVDLTISDLSAFVSRQVVSDNGVVFIYDKANKMIAASEALRGIPLLSDVTGVQDPAVRAVVENGAGQGISAGYYTDLRTITEGGTDIKVAISAPQSDFQHSIMTMQQQVVMLTALSVIVFLPIALFFSNRLSQRVRWLVDDAKRITKKEFHAAERPKSHIIEICDLEHSFVDMRGALAVHAAALAVSQEKLSRLVELGIAMSAERDTEKVMEMVLLGAKELANADGGTLYKIEKDVLAFRIVRTTSLDVAMGGTSGVEPTIPPVPLFNEAGEQNHKNVVSHTVHESLSVNIEDAYNNEDFDFSGTKVFDEMNGYRSQSFLTVPLKPRGGDVIGALQIINAQNSDGVVVPFSEEIQRFVEALAAQAATILYNRELLEAQELLMDSLIKLIAGAIDAKSPYTGGHCERVPQLATMLAKEANGRTDGVFANFHFETEEQWREFSIGAWLHDCGKVVVPEYVVDKATKLETIYNRIHEIRTRFEVLLRDATIDYYKEIVDGKDADAAALRLEERRAELVDDFAFVAECNVGGEFMSDEKLDRLKTIAEKTWVRNFDAKLGLSYEESRLDPDIPAAPVEEKLLDDKPGHIIPRQGDSARQYAHLDFKTPVPENLYNRGEIYNLGVSRGTLTEEERFKIAEHVMQTIVMLEALPLPPHLQRVPEYAGTHHETLIGSGYPRKLDADALSVPSRIMAIADIFEALTASDRPYKKAKSLSEAIRILSFFKKDNHIDPEIFDLFLTSGVYRVYAERFLLPEQIDDVDIAQYVS